MINQEQNKMNIISNCPLCEERSLHVLEQPEVKVMQCINCGFSSSSQFTIHGGMENNKHYKILPEQMKRWSKVATDKFWIPTMFTLPFGVLYPENDENENLQWRYAEMINIPEDKQKDYPIEGKEGEYYKTKYDTENPIAFGSFLEAMDHVNSIAKSRKPKTEEPELKEFKLPKLKKL